MVGRLARYLRMLGCDTVYARGWSDEAIARYAATEERVLVTRDRALARRAAGSVLLTSPRLEDQFRAVRAALPDLPTDVRFDRCTRCNGTLHREDPPAAAERAEGVPWDRVDRGLPLYRCGECGHRYWEGTHTKEVRHRAREWAAGREG